MVRPSHARSRIAMDRFRHDSLVRNLWKLLLDQLHIFLVGIDKDVVGRYYLHHSIIGLLELSATHAKEINELFRIIAPAARPESSTLTTCEYHAIIVVIVYSHFCIFTV